MQNVFPEATTEMRHVVYTCYQPADLATESDLAQKKAAYDQFRLTTHWPAMNIRLYDDESAVGRLFLLLSPGQHPPLPLHRRGSKAGRQIMSCATCLRLVTNCLWLGQQKSPAGILLASFCTAHTACSLHCPEQRIGSASCDVPAFMSPLA